MSERVVYLKDIGKYLVRHWKAAIILMLVLGVALNFFAVYKETGSAQGPDAKKDAVIALEEGLSEREIADARTAADGYMLVYDQIMSETGRIKESPLFLLDAAAAFEDRLLYRVRTEESLPQGADDGILLKNYAEVLTGSLVKTLIEEGLSEEEACKIRDLSDVEAEDGFLIVRAFSENEETVVKAGASMKKAVDRAAETIKASGEKTEFVLVSEDCRKGAETSLVKARAKKLEVLQESSGVLPVFSENLSSAAKKYFNALVEYKKGFVERAGAVRKWFYPKWTALGVLGGLFLFLLLFGLVYLFSAKIRNSEEVREGLGIPAVFDISLNGGKKSGAVSAGKGIASMLDRIRYGENGGSVRKVTVITGSEENEFQEKLKTAMTEAGIEADVIEDFHAEENLLKRVSASDGLLFVKRIGKDRFDEMNREIEAVKPSGKPVFGAILLRD